MDEPHILRMLDACANHLPLDVFLDLNGHDGVTAHETDFGWLLHVPSVIPDDDEGLTPAAIVRLWRYAAKLHCVYIMLDRDADTLPRLPTYDW